MRCAVISTNPLVAKEYSTQGTATNCNPHVDHFPELRWIALEPNVQPLNVSIWQPWQISEIGTKRVFQWYLHSNGSPPECGSISTIKWLLHVAAEAAFVLFPSPTVFKCLGPGSRQFYSSSLLTSAP
jgi:hypothetical protein